MDIECNHVDNGHNVCLHCHHTLANGPKAASMLVKNNKSLWREGLDKATFLPEAIRLRADEIYQGMGINSCRKGRREVIIVHTLLKALEENGIAVTPDDLVAKLGYHSSITSRLQSVSVEQAIMSNNGVSSVKISTPRSLLPVMAKKLKIQDGQYYNNLHRFTDEFLDEFADNPSLMNIPPKQIMAGLIYYYLVLQSIEEIKVSEFAATLGVAVSSLTTVYKILSKLIK